MADVFISYKREDHAVAEVVAAALQSSGLTVWWDREIPAGKSYFRMIEEELQKAGHVVVLWSPASVVSEWVWNEAREAAEQGKLIPVRIAECKAPTNFGHLQTLEMRAPFSDIGPLLKALGKVGPELELGAGASVPAATTVPPAELSGAHIDFERYNLIDAYGAAINMRAGVAILGGKGGHAVLWDLKAGRPRRQWQALGSDLNRFAFSADGAVVATLSQSGRVARLWPSEATASPIAEVSGPERMWGAAFLDVAGPQLISGRDDTHVELRSVDHKSRVWHHAINWHCATAAPNGSRIAIGNRSGGIVRLLDSRNGAVIRDLGPHKSDIYIRSLAFTSDSARLASGDNGGTVHIWGVATNRQLGEFGYGKPVEALAFCAQDRFLACGGGGNAIVVWDTVTSGEPKVLEGHTQTILALAFNTAGNRLISASRDGTIKVWEWPSGTLLATLVAFVDGEHVVIGSDGCYSSSPGADKYLYLMVDGHERGVTEAYRNHFSRTEGIVPT